MKYYVIAHERVGEVMKRVDDLAKMHWKLVGPVQVSVASDPPHGEHYTVYVATMQKEE